MVFLLTPNCSHAIVEEQQTISKSFLSKCWQKGNRKLKGNRKILSTFPDQMIPTELRSPSLKNKLTQKIGKMHVLKNQVKKPTVFPVKLLSFSPFPVPSIGKEKQKKPAGKLSEAHWKFCISLQFIWKNSKDCNLGQTTTKQVTHNYEVYPH